jgi:hypothetical protein
MKAQNEPLKEEPAAEEKVNPTYKVGGGSKEGGNCRRHHQSADVKDEISDGAIPGIPKLVQKPGIYERRRFEIVLIPLAGQIRVDELWMFHSSLINLGSIL